jgi:mono/diheme cytochrome c family protein
MAGPITYELDGEQYVAVVAGFRQTGNYYAPNYSRLLVYKSGGTASLPVPAPFPDPVLDPPVAFGDAATLAHGEEVYGRFCSTCHGADGLSRGMFPDLRYSPALATDAAFRQVVLDGVRAQNGMVSFAKALKPEDVEAVRAYLVGRAQELKAAQSARAAPAADAQPHGQ